VDGQPRRCRRLAEEAGQLNAPDPVGTDLLRGDAAAGELLGEEVAGVAQPPAGDELALGIGARPGRNPQIGVRADCRGARLGVSACYGRVWSRTSGRRVWSRTSGRRVWSRTSGRRVWSRTSGRRVWSRGARVGLAVRGGRGERGERGDEACERDAHHLLGGGWFTLRCAGTVSPNCNIVEELRCALHSRCWQRHSRSEPRWRWGAARRPGMTLPRG